MIGFSVWCMKLDRNQLKSQNRLSQSGPGGFFSLQEGELMLDQQCINGTL
jgi:hypothetical protein